jgi:hypothetical protein
VADQVPVLDAVVAAIAVVLLPSYSLTVDAASAVPVNVGVVSFVLVPLDGLDMTGAAGGVVSELLPLLDTVTEMLRVPTLLYGSYPLASRVCEPFGTEAVFHEMW